MRLSRWFLLSLLTLLLPGSAFAAGGLVISGGGGNVNISGMLSVTNPTSPGIQVTSRIFGQVNLNGATTLNTGAQHAVSLSSNSTGHTTSFGGTLDIDTTSGTGFFASTGGTFVATGPGNSITSTAGQAVSLSTTPIGPAGANFGSVVSQNSPNRGIHLNNMEGTLTTTGGSITGAAGIPVEVNGGTVYLTYAGGITQAANNPMVQVTGGHNTGTLTFQTGTLNATNGSGLQFNNADGTYAFNGTTTLNGGDAGVDITNGSSGTFDFGTAATITNPSGAAFNINGSNCAGTFSGSITDNSGFAIDVDNHDSGTYTFQTGTLTSTGQGVRVANSNGGAIDFGFPTKTLNTAANTAVTLNTNNGGGTVNFTGGGLDIDTTTATAFSATGGGTVNVTGANNTIDTTTGRPVEIQNTNAGGSGITFARALSSGGGQVANIVTSTGTKTLGRVSTSSGATTALNLNAAGTVNIGDAALASSLTTTSAPAITINNSTLGFSGLGVGLNTTGGGAGMSVTGGTVAIAGNGMVINTDSATDGPGFVATSGGTVTVQGTGHTVTSGNQTAVNIANTTIGANDVTFQSVSAGSGVGSSGVGINIDTTGASGGFHVTGTGSPGSGGTIQHKTGTDGSTTGGIGIYLNDTDDTQLSWMQLNDFDNFAIRGLNVIGFNLSNSVISSSGGGWNGTNSAGGFNEGSVSFSNLSGAASISDTNISGGFADNFRVVNNAGTLNRITFDTVTIGPNSNGAALDGSQDQGNDGITLESQNAAVINVTIQNSTFTSARGDLFQLNNIGTGSNDLIFTNNDLSNNYPRIATGGGGVSIFTNGTGNLTFNMSGGNTFRDSLGTALLFVKSTGPATLSGTFSGNTIGVPGIANSGSAEGSGLKIQNSGQGTVTTLITNNSIHQYNNHGIELLTGGGATAYSGNFNSTITGNTISNPGNNPATAVIAKNGIHLNGGTVPLDTYQIALDIGGSGALANSLSNSGAPNDSMVGGEDIRLRQRQDTTVQLRGYTGASNDDAAVASYVIARNGGDGAPSAIASNNASTGSDGFYNTPGPGGAVPQP